MLSKRIIACLDVQDGAVVKGINFEGLRNAGDPATLVLDDGWTVCTADGQLSAHFEHTVALRENAPADILTRVD